MKYERLNKEREEIRVFSIINPDDVDDRIQLQVQIVSLQETTANYRDFESTPRSRQFPLYPDLLSQWMLWVEDRSPEGSAVSNVAPDAMFSMSLRRWSYAWRVGRYNRTPEGYFIYPDWSVTYAVPGRFIWGDFETVSYRWTPKFPEKEIVVNGEVTFVPANLEEALQALRKLPETKNNMKYWIDYLCINQSPDGQEAQQEKEYQVKLMGKIYGQCLSVIAWLGREADGSDEAISLMSEIESYELDGKDGATLATTTAAQWRTLKSFFSREYWQRVWMVQELALNHHMTLFLCGSTSFSRIMLKTACGFCVDSTFGTVQPHRPSISIPIGNEHGFELWGDFASLANNVYQLVSLDAEAPLDTVLDLGRKAGTSILLDKIYGVRSLLPEEIRERIEPDYNVSVEQLFISFSRILLETSNRLDTILSWCTLSPSMNNALPTWVPNWTVPYTRHMLSQARERSASLNKMSQWQMLSGGRELCCRGIIVDTIASLGTSLQHESEHKIFYQKSKLVKEHEEHLLPNHYGDISAVREALQNLLRFDIPLHERSGPHSSLDIFWIDWNILNNYPGTTSQGQVFTELLTNEMKLVVAHGWWKSFDCFRQANADFSVLGYHFRSFFPDMFSYQPHQEHRSRLNESVVYYMKLAALAVRGRRLATTKTGYLGLVPAEAQLGDVVAVLYGCNFPVILRPNNGAFNVVGECCVPGMMDGEVIHAEERGECQSTDILLQ